MNIKLVAHTLGRVINFEAICLALTLVCSLIMHDGAHFSIIISIAICLAAGIPLALVKPKEKRLFSRDGFATVALSWIAMSIFGSLPFVISGVISNPIDAFFETASGITTTGALPPSSRE